MQSEKESGNMGKEVVFDYSKATGFISAEEMANFKKTVMTAKETLLSKEGAGNDYLGWIDLPVDYDKDEFARIKKAAAKIQSDSDVLLVVGIGGSYLGARAAIEFLSNSFYNVLPKDVRKTPEIYFVGNSISSKYIADLKKVLAGKDFSINIISKSGTTTEPAIAFRIFKEMLIEKYGREEANKRIYATTDKARGALKSLADEEGYTNAANTLNIAAADDTKIVDKDEKEYKGDLDKNDLIVFYGVSTKSIPAQTTPTKVVVLGENEIALKQIEAAKNATPAPTVAPETTAAPEVTEAPQVSYAGLVNVVIGDKNVSDVYAKDNTTMVPLREVAEAAGFTVTWDAENRAVILNDGVYSLKIGENSYVKGKMMPLTLSAAPEIVNDLTYVPAEFFAEVTESATVDGTSLVVTAK